VSTDPLSLVGPTLLGDAVDGSPHAIIVSEEDFGPVIAVNEAACRLLGYSRQELLRLPSTTWAASEREVVAHVYDRLRRRGSHVRATARLRRKDGTLVEIDYWASTTKVSGMDFLLTVTDPIDQAVVVSEG
jgi:PAS domain S-box-containing protein